MLRKMDVDVSCFKIELLKAIATTKKYSPSNSPPPHPPATKKNNVEVRLDHFRPKPNNIDQGGVKRGVTG